MNKLSVFYVLFFIGLTVQAQNDFSDEWLDFFSYNNVKDIIAAEDKIYAITDNAVFIYDATAQATEKRSSVNGLSGGEASAIFFSSATENLVVGYTSGLLEVIDKKGKITVATDIERLTVTGEKSVNHMVENENKLFLSTSFGIVAYDLEKLEFGDTYFIGNNASAGDGKPNRRQQRYALCGLRKRYLHGRYQC